MTKLFFLLIAFFTLGGCQTKFASCDVLIVGGSASGTVAAITSARLGAKTILVEETPWLGGMLTAAGVSAVDGNYTLRGGLWGEFFNRLVTYYGGADSLKTGWVSNTLFEPGVGNAIWSNLVECEEMLITHFTTSIDTLYRSGNSWTVVLNNQQTGEKHRVMADVVIDATELGDVAARLGVPYDLGMDSREQTGEQIAPRYANNIVQDMTYVMILKDYGSDRTIARPEGYDSTLFVNTASWEGNTTPRPGQTIWPIERMLDYGRLPNGKYMINWPIEGNDYYLNIVELSPEERIVALERAKHFSRCYLYFMQTALGLNTYDMVNEFGTPDAFPWIPYHRESRRIRGEVRFTVNDAASPYARNIYRTAIAVGDYPVDHHHHRYPQSDTLPALHFYPIPSYSLPLGVLIPKGFDKLIVAEKSISVSNIVNGTTRLQPVVMGIGQAAGTLAAMSALGRKPLREVAVRDVQQSLLGQGAYLLPYLDVPVGDANFAAYQRIGATGILRGEGKNEGWTNQTWFNADQPIEPNELAAGVEIFYGFKPKFNGEEVSRSEAMELLQHLGAEVEVSLDDTSISRGEFAVLLDSLLNPFDSRSVNLQGNYN